MDPVALAHTHTPLQVHYCTGFPNDPSRERVGYTQDTVNMFRGAAFEFASSETMYARWAQDMADGQAYAYKHPGNGIPPGPGQMPTVIPGVSGRGLLPRERWCRCTTVPTFLVSTAQVG